MRADVVHTLPYTDVTDVPVTRPSGTGSATSRALTGEEQAELVEREKRRVPLGFQPPPDKPKRRKR